MPGELLNETRLKAIRPALLACQVVRKGLHALRFSTGPSPAAMRWLASF